GTGDDGGHVGFVLIETLDGVAAATGCEAILTGHQVCEEEAAVGVGQERLDVVEGVCGSKCDFDEAERLATEGVNNDAADAKGRRRSRSGGIKRGDREQK